MKKILTIYLSLLIFPLTAKAGPLINEISAGTGNDWVEITLSGDTESCDISQYYVTMYYGKNEKISDSAVILRNRDLPETPWDDRFVVVHFTPVPVDDETDSTGDTNGNGVLDVYCCNYGLWNTDCVVAIDTDDDPANGGIIDFVAYSNRDGTINSTIQGYINSAISAGQWEACICANLQECAVDAGINGLNSYSTISRLKGTDTNSLRDFVVTPYATPGRDNITNVSSSGRKLFRTETKNKSHSFGSGTILIPLFIYKKCSLKLRLFNSTGFTIYTSDLVKDINPGYYTFSIPESSLSGRITTGLYPVKIEGVGDGSASDTATFFLVIIRHRK